MNSACCAASMHSLSEKGLCLRSTQLEARLMLLSSCCNLLCTHADSQQTFAASFACSKAVALRMRLSGSFDGG